MDLVLITNWLTIVKPDMALALKTTLSIKNENKLITTITYLSKTASKT